MVVLRARQSWRKALPGAGLAAVFSLASPALAASDWVAGQHSAARLLDGGASTGALIGGVEIRLDPSFITYWRNPGEAGVPPVFDVSRSVNLKQVEVEYPAPRLLDEDGSAVYGYAEGVTFPLRITPLDASAPVRLDLTLDYAVCSRLCLPARAHLAATLDGAATEAEELREALAAVPKAAALGQPGPMRIEAVAWTSPGTMRVRTVAPDGAASLFVEAPEPWYFSTSPGQPVGSGELDFLLKAQSLPPPGALPSEPLRLTLVASSGAIEVAVPLDAVAAKP